MNVGDLVWMPPNEDQYPGAVPVESELVCGLILSEPRKGCHRPARVQVLWTEPDGTTAIDWEPVDWLRPLNLV
jgi:hypothetical protein